MGGASTDSGCRAWVGVAPTSDAGRVRPMSGGDANERSPSHDGRQSGRGRRPASGVGGVRPSRDGAGERSHPASGDTQC
jgi:hypothetical protein